MPLDNRTPEVRNQPQTRPEVAEEKDRAIAAHEAADKDILADQEMDMTPDPAKDLDEGELARYEAENGKQQHD